MGVTLAVLRQRFAARVTAIGGTGVATWNESPLHFDNFGKEAGTIRQLCFAVGLPRTVAAAASGGDRQRVDVGARTTQVVVVAFTHEIRPNDQVASGDEALAQELALIQQLCQHDGTWPLDFHVLYTGSERRLIGNQWHRTDVTFLTDPLLPLQ